MSEDRGIVVVFNDDDMPDDTWLDWYRSEFPTANFRRSAMVKPGTAVVTDQRAFDLGMRMAAEMGDAIARFTDIMRAEGDNASRALRRWIDGTA